MLTRHFCFCEKEAISVPFPGSTCPTNNINESGREQLAYPHKKLHFLVVLQLLFVEAHGLIVVAAENTVTLHHSLAHGP